MRAKFGPFRRRRASRAGRRLRPALAVVLAILTLWAVLSLAGIAAMSETRSMGAYATRVVDGDTIALGGLAVRLAGIASPEEGHRVHVAARRHLEALLRESDRVECRLRKTSDRYGRRIGRCDAVDDAGLRIDLQRAMVEAGLARACPGWGSYRYLLYENAESLALPFPRYCWPG